jgi:BirA family biotin operon repressor/biotin-[acetyl-CoA-carboxylase] ligase
MGQGGDDWPEPYDRRLLAEVDSTNAEAARLAPGLTRPTWVVAHRQTGGRGRRGRAWLSPEGNFAGSLILWPTGSAAEAAQRSFVAALAVEEALHAAIGPGATLALKWPNDVLLNGGKVAGILLERSGQGAGAALVVGIGVNLAHAPPREALEPGALAAVSVVGETGLGLTPEAFLSLLAPAFARHEAQLATFGFAPIRTAWLSRAARLGQPIIARTAAEDIAGTFETIDEDGALILRSATGRRTLPAADISF